MNQTDRIGDCEYEHLDKDAGDCHGQATHVLRDAGLVVCSNHVDGANLLLRKESEYADAFDDFNESLYTHQETKNESLQQAATGLAIVEPAGGQHVSGADPSDGVGIVLSAAGISGPAGASVAPETH